MESQHADSTLIWPLPGPANEHASLAERYDLRCRLFTSTHMRPGSSRGVVLHLHAVEPMKHEIASTVASWSRHAGVHIGVWTGLQVQVFGLPAYLQEVHPSL